MTTDPHPAKRVFVTVSDVRRELVPTSKFTFPETRELQRVSGGLSLVELEERIAKADVNAWFAWMYVSIRRERPTLTVAELEAAIGDTPLLAVIESVEEEAPEVADPDPPAQASLSDAAEQQNGNGSGEKTPLRSILATAGPQT